MLSVDIRVSHDGKVIAEHQDVRVTLLPNLSLRDATISDFDKLMVGVAAR